MTVSRNEFYQYLKSLDENAVSGPKPEVGAVHQRLLAIVLHDACRNEDLLGHCAQTLYGRDDGATRFYVAKQLDKLMVSLRTSSE